MENNKTPSIRFKGFTDPWEQRKVLDLLELLTDYDANGSFADMAKNVNTTDGDGYAWYVRITDLENPKPLSELKYVDESSYEFLKKTELHGGELLMAKRGDIGKVYIFEPRTKYATVAPNMYLLKLNNKVIPHFLYDYFVSEEGNKKLTRLNASSTMGALYKDDVKNIDVIMPSIEEQAMIGNFFQSIDHLITLHQCKYDKLQNIKKSMLEKMFPKNGSNVPEIRFSGFTDPWEQRKLGDIITEYKVTVDSDCTLPILTSSKTEGVILQEEHFGRKQHHDITGYNILPRNYCTYRNRSDGVDFTFNINKCCDKGIISKFYPVFSGKNSDVFFLSLVLNNSDEVVREIAYTCTGTGQKVLSFLDLQKMKVRVPNFDEQKEIAAYFESLDHLITLHQRELEKLQNIKKSMLEKMFV